MDDELINFDEPMEETGSQDKSPATVDEIFNGPASNSKPDYLSDYLSNAGIDRDNIKIVNEDGQIESRHFDDLSDDDKYAVMHSTRDLPISEDELKTLAFMRANNMNLEQYAAMVQNQTVQNMAENMYQNKPSYTVDGVSDEELIRLDLELKYPNYTDEEINYQLDSILANESIAQKTVAQLRQYYTDLENSQRAEEIEEARYAHEAEINAQRAAISQELVNTAHNTNQICGFELEDQDKREILSYLLDTDVNGASQFSKLTASPDALFHLAWFALKGPEAFRAIEEYWAKQSRASKSVSRSRSPQQDDDSFGLNKYFGK